MWPRRVVASFATACNVIQGHQHIIGNIVKQGCHSGLPLKSAAFHACSCFWHVHALDIYEFMVATSEERTRVLTSASQSGHLPALGALARCHVFFALEPYMHQTLRPIQIPQLHITRTPNPFLPLALCSHDVLMILRMQQSAARSGASSQAQRTRRPQTALIVFAG